MYKRQPFNPVETITRMRSGRNWPRPGYLRSLTDLASSINELQAIPGSDYLVSLLQSSPLDEHAFCQAAKQLSTTSSHARMIVDTLSMSDADIMRAWDVNRDTAAHQGNLLCIREIVGE